MEKIILDLSLDNKLYHTNIFDAALQEIEMLFETSNCELLGDYHYGTNFEEFLWTMTPTTTELKNYIDKKLEDLIFVNQLHKHVEVFFYKDEITFETIYHIKINLYNDFSSVEKNITLKESEV